MTAIQDSPNTGTTSLGHALESAVVLGWNELLPSASSGVVRIEYHTRPNGSVEYLQVWASSERGYWKLVCEYRACSLLSHQPELSFASGYRAGDFSRRLESVMQREPAFARLPRLDGAILTYPPTEAERAAAAAWTSAQGFLTGAPSAPLRPAHGGATAAIAA